MNEPALLTYNCFRHIDKLDEVWHSLPNSFSLEQRIDFIFPLLFLRLASIHADEKLAETADIYWTELSESALPLKTYQNLRPQLCDPNTWPEAYIFSGLPAVELQHQQSLQTILNWLKELDMYALQYRDIGEFWENCLQKCLTTHSSYVHLSPPLALTNALVALLQPQPQQHFYDPAAGGGSFLVAAHDYVHMLLEERNSLPPEHTCYISAQIHSTLEQRLCLANLRLHDIPMSDLRIVQPHQPKQPEAIDLIFANLAATLTENTDVPALLQQSLQCLKPNGHALFLLPDQYLSEVQFAAWRQHCLQSYQLHTLLRLPNGLFSKNSSVLFISHTGTTEKLWIYDLRTQVPKQSFQNEQLASILGHFTWAYGEEREPNPQQREARASKDLRLRSWCINELGRNLDLTPDWLSDVNTKHLTPLSGIKNISSKQWRGLLNETLQDLHQLDKLLDDDDKT